MDAWQQQCQAVSSGWKAERKTNLFRWNRGGDWRQRQAAKTVCVAIADIYESEPHTIIDSRALNLADILGIDVNPYTLLHSRFMKSGINVPGCMIVVVVVVTVDDTQTQHIFCVNLCIVRLAGSLPHCVSMLFCVMLAIAQCFSSPYLSRCLEIISIFSVQLYTAATTTPATKSASFEQRQSAAYINYWDYYHRRRRH